MGVRQYKNDESLKSKENEPQTEVSWATPWGKATMKKVADLNETESYDTTKSFYKDCLLYTSPSPRDGLLSRMPSSA